MLKIKNLSVSYKAPTIKDVSLTVEDGQIVGIVGESGSGKSTILKSILGLLPACACQKSNGIFIDGRDIHQLSPEELRSLRGNEISMIFQQPELYLDPICTIESQFYETVAAHKAMDKDSVKRLAIKILESLYFTEDSAEQILKKYPFELSGGMCQRVAIAIAMVNHPKVLLADEPTSALDVTVQAQVAQSMIDMRDKFGTSILLVTHNMGLVTYMADMIGVIYKGELVEFGTKEDVLFSPKHSYTKNLINSVPSLG